ncbi:MAG TPA: DUF3786 domain-containing protein [Desulfobacterales bacterium]|nr:DUF3786 domain-containing protein [Desulfobacterales bacterium]
MQPLEFIKFTPRTNCRECGYPACLAFAAAVTKGGENPEKCPYVDLAKLGDEFSGGNHGKDGLDGVGKLLDDKDVELVAYLQRKTSDIDFAAAAEAIGCEWSGPEKDCLLLQYFGRDVELSHDGIRIDGKDVEDPRDQILLYNYVHFAGGDKPTQEWIGMESLPNSISKIRTLRVYCEERISEYFAGKTDLLKTIAPQLGAETKENPEQSCSAAFFIPALPRLPLFVLFWDEEKEDGFPAKVKVLFDQKVLDFLDIESLVFVCERMAERWVELAK